MRVRVDEDEPTASDALERAEAALDAVNNLVAYQKRPLLASEKEAEIDMEEPLEEDSCVEVARTQIVAFLGLRRLGDEDW